MNDYKTRIIQYKSSLEIAREWLYAGIICKSEFDILSALLAKKYSINLDSIFFEKSG